MDLKLLKMRCKDSKQHHVMYHELYSVSLLLCKYCSKCSLRNPIQSLIFWNAIFNNVQMLCLGVLWPMYPCFECLPTIQWFRTVVKCKLCFVARTTRYAVLSEVKCLRAQFFVLERWCTTAICKHKDSRSLATRGFYKMWRYFDSVATTAEEKNWIFPAKFQIWKRATKVCIFTMIVAWLKHLDESFIKIERKCTNQMLNSEHLTCKVGLSFKSIVEFLYLLSVVELVRSWVSN